MESSLLNLRTLNGKGFPGKKQIYVLQISFTIDRIVLIMESSLLDSCRFNGRDFPGKK